MILYPILESQKGVLAECLENPQITYYNLSTITAIPQSISKEKLVRSLQKTIDCLPVLKTRFLIQENGKLQQGHDENIKIKVHSHKLKHKDMTAYIQNTFLRPFDIAGGEALARFELATTEVGTFLLINIHHTITDAYSYSTVFFNNILANIYNEKPVVKEEIDLYYASLGEDIAFHSENYHQAKEYFREKFANAHFFTLKENTTDSEGRLIIDRCGISRPLCDNFCKEHDIRVNILFQGALSYILAILSNRETVCYSAEYHGRNSTKLRTTFGMLEKTLPVVTMVKKDITIIDYLKNIQSEMKEITRNSLYPFTHFYNDTQHDTGLTFNFRAIESIASKQKFFLEDKPLDYHWIHPQMGRNYMIVNVDFTKDGDYCIITEYNSSLMKQDTLNHLTHSTAKFIKYMAKHPADTLGHLEDNIFEIQHLKEIRHIIHLEE